MSKKSDGNNMNGSTSIELVSKDGPIPINIMMQEGVKALTTILSNQLQDRKSFQNTEHGMQFIRRSKVNKKPTGNEHSDKAVEELGDEDVVEIDDQSNYHFHSTMADPELVLDDDEVNKFLEEKFPDPELHINGEEAEIIFDYERQDLEDVPEGIGKRISEMIESVLPGSFSTDVHGRLHAVVNGNELNITEEGATDDESHNGIEDGDLTRRPIPELNITLEDERGEDPGERVGMLESHINGSLSTDEEYHNHEDGYCPHHHQYHHHHNQQGPSKFRNYNYHDFAYNLQNPIKSSKKAPDFSVLLEPKKPMCMFCEYYMVFGEPPRNMIKWYNNMFGYNRLPTVSNGDHRHNHNHRNHQQQQQHQNGHGKRIH